MSHTPQPKRHPRPKCRAMAFDFEQRGQVRPCSDMSVETVEGTPLCYAHAKAIANKFRTEPLEICE